jgi:hypothetical protein
MIIDARGADVVRAGQRLSLAAAEDAIREGGIALLDGESQSMCDSECTREVYGQ